MVSGLSLCQEKTGLNHRLPFSRKRSILLKSSTRVCCGGLCQEILDLETAVILDQDDAGTLPKTGSIGGVTCQIRLALKIVFQEQDRRFRESPLQMRVTNLVSRSAVTLAGGLFLRLHQAAVGDEILNLGKRRISCTS